MTMFLYNLLLPVAMLVYLPVFVYRQLRRGNFLPALGERFGFFGNAQHAALKRLRAPVWVHAVSVGEVVAALGFIRRWQEREPEREFVLSTTTTTGRATAQTRLPERVRLIYCPFDLAFAVRRVLRVVRPRLLVIFEVEIWPNLITLAARAGARVVLVNGRVSERSGRGYRRHLWFFGPVFRCFSLFCVQSDEDQGRLRGIVGSDVPVVTCDTMKFDQVPDAGVQDKSALLDRFFGAGERLVWTAGSTHAGEEELVADTFLRLRADFPALRLVLVPRHHERTPQAESVLRARGLRYRLLRPSGGGEDPAASAPVEVLLVNTTGELMGFYAAADVAYVGKSLAGNTGGHNIIEPAIFGKPIVCGANMQNFRRVMDAFLRADAVAEVSQDELLEPTLRRLLASPEERLARGRRAREVVEHGRGAMDRTLALLAPLLS
jgi:3-deoxy-D-manno-octulosonic-acid transferase